MSFDVREYWSGVGEAIAARGDGDTSAGDRSPYIAYQSACVERRFFAPMPIAGRSVLEVGCGPGGKLSVVQARGPARLVGADMSPVMLELARKRLGDAVELAQLEPGAPYPFADREFDLVYTCTVLHHNPHERVPEILAEIARVSGSEITLIEATARRPVSPSAAFHIRRASDYADILARHDFELVSERPLGTGVSEQMAGWAMRLAHTRHLRRPPYVEGAPIAPLRLRLERALLPLTRRLDTRLPQRHGLSALQFARR